MNYNSVMNTQEHPSDDELNKIRMQQRDFHNKENALLTEIMERRYGEISLRGIIGASRYVRGKMEGLIAADGGQQRAPEEYFEAVRADIAPRKEDEREAEADEDERMETFARYMALLSATEIAREAALQARELSNTEPAEKAVTQIVLKLGKMSPQERQAAYPDVAAMLDEYAKHDAGWFRKVCEKLRYMPMQDQYRLSLLMDRDASHDAHVRKAAQRDVRRQMVTERPLDVHASVLDASEKDLCALDGKDLVLVGGGPVSPLPQQLAERGIRPTVINVDPTAEETAAAPGYTPVRGTFLDAQDLPERSREIWALRSLPTYALPEEILPFYLRALRMLEDGGTLRVAPYVGFAEGWTPRLMLTRAMANALSQRIVQELQDGGVFRVRTVETREDVQATAKQNPWAGVGLSDRAELASVPVQCAVIENTDPARAEQELLRIAHIIEDMLAQTAKVD